MKTCTLCGQAKPLDEFHRFRHSKDGRSPHCKPCRNAYNKASYERKRAAAVTWAQAAYRRDPAAALARAVAWKDANLERHRFLQRRSHLKRHYGITPEQYDALLAAQGGVCAICKQPSAKRLHVDHDHACCRGRRSCGKCIRGLLCFGCNRLLGWYEANQHAITNYLAREPAHGNR